MSGYRAVLNITKATDILDHIYSLPMDQQLAAMEAIRNIEREAMKSQKPQPGLVELMSYLTSKDVRKGICTRNFEYDPLQPCGKTMPFAKNISLPVNHLLTTFLPDHV